jgi:hypothetical protein
VADYASGLHGPIAADRIAVTSGGVNALMLAVQMLVDAGDEVLAVTPVWPNLTAQPLIMGARLRCLALKPQADGAWALDLPALLAAITPTTRLLVVNSPNNPTGWTLTRAEQQAILARCRETGTWILADEVYERLYYRSDGPGRGAFLSGHCQARRPAGGGAKLFQGLPDDRLAPGLADHAGGDDAAHGQADRVQHLLRAGVRAARRAGRAGADRGHHPRIVAHLRQCRDTLVPLLQAVPGVHTSAAPGGMYAFLRIDGFADSLAWPSAWWPRPAWAWPRAWPLRPRPRAGCAGALPRSDVRAWGRACSGCRPGWPGRLPGHPAGLDILHRFCIWQNARGAQFRRTAQVKSFGTRTLT